MQSSTQGWIIEHNYYDELTCEVYNIEVWLGLRGMQLPPYAQPYAKH